MLPRDHSDRIQVALENHRPVENVGLLLPANLALRLGLSQLVQQRLDLGDAPAQANNGGKIMTLVTSAQARGDCIDDADELRDGAAGLAALVSAAMAYSADAVSLNPYEGRLPGLLAVMRYYAMVALGNPLFVVTISLLSATCGVAAIRRYLRQEDPPRGGC